MTERLGVTTNRGCVRLLVGDVGEQLAVVMSPEHARLLIAELQDAIGVAELDNEETKASMVEDDDASDVRSEEGRGTEK